MTARIIWIGKNNKMVVAPRSALSAGASTAARPVVLPVEGRAAQPSLPPRCPSLRGNLGAPQRGAPLFDATSDRWIVSPSGMTPDAVAAAEQRQPARNTRFPSTRPNPAAVPSAAGRFWHEAVEVFTVALGLTVFGLIAGFFLVLA